jgi:hypothetical protein
MIYPCPTGSNRWLPLSPRGDRISLLIDVAVEIETQSYPMFEATTEILLRTTRSRTQLMRLSEPARR